MLVLMLPFFTTDTILCKYQGMKPQVTDFNYAVTVLIPQASIEIELNTKLQNNYYLYISNAMSHRWCALCTKAVQ